MTLPTEPVGSIPRPLELVNAVALLGDSDDARLDALYDAAIRDSIARFEQTGSPVITDGEQRKYHNFWTYSVHGLANTAPDGFRIPFAAGHTRRMPRLTAGPFRYKRYADSYLEVALRYARVPVKQAVISPSALSLMYPAEGIPGYSREQFIDDLLQEHETEIHRCLQLGAHKVQIDFTEGRLAMKIDPSGTLLNSFIDLNNLALSRFSAEERLRIGVHTCPGGDRDSTHSAEVDYDALLPMLFELKAGNFYVALAGEKDRSRVLDTIRRFMKPDQRIFVGVVSPIDPGSRRRRKSASGCWKLPHTSRFGSLAQPMTADSRRSATTYPPAATLPSRRSACVFWARRWRIGKLEAVNAAAAA